MTDPTLDTLVKWVSFDRRSCHGGNGTWTKGRWRRVTPPLVPCERGLHVVTIAQSPQWIAARVGLVEVRGERIDQADKSVVSEARITEWLPWDERTARLWAADCAEHVLPLWEASCPVDGRPRRAIEAARLYATGRLTHTEMIAAYAAAYATYAARASAASAAAAYADAAAAAAYYAAAYATYAARASADYAAYRAANATYATAYRAGQERRWQAARLLAYLSGEA